MISPKLQRTLFDEGYMYLKEISGKVCGIMPFLFTWGLVVGLDEFGYSHRFCYDSRSDAVEAIGEYTSLDTDPPGNWIKEKGRGDRPNPNYQPET